MLITLAAILPIFGIIGLGFAGRRFNIFGPTAHSELSRFVVKLALPALLFAIMAEAKPNAIWQPDFLLAFGGGGVVVMIVTMLFRRRVVPSSDATIDGLAASYSNAAFVGIPLCLALFGPQSLIVTSIATIITVCVIFALSILLMEVVLQSGTGAYAAFAKALLAAARNPMVFAPVAGAVFSFGGVVLPDPARRLVDLLGAAASPCALVALGLFIAEKRPAVLHGPVLQLVAVKLLLQPAITWVIAYHVLSMPPLWAKAAVLIAALPTGTGPFMLAELYGREADVTARVILVSTLISIGTLTLLMTLL